MPQSFPGGPRGTEQQYNENLSPRITNAIGKEQSFWPAWEMSTHVPYYQPMATQDIFTIQLSLRPSPFTAETVVRLGIVPSTGQSALDALRSYQAVASGTTEQLRIP